MIVIEGLMKGMYQIHLSPGFVECPQKLSILPAAADRNYVMIAFGLYAMVLYPPSLNSDC
jgi:hypothetical protein